MPKIRIRWKAVVPAAGILVGVLADPDAVGAIAGALPPKVAHGLLVASAIAAIFAPAAATNRPKSSPASEPPEDL
jgi:hypothetical protein